MEKEPTIKDVLTAVQAQDARMGLRFEATDRHIDEILETVNKGFSGVQVQIEDLKTKVGGLGLRMDKVENRLEGIENKLDRTDGKVNALVNVLERKTVITENEKRTVLA